MTEIQTVATDRITDKTTKVVKDLITVLEIRVIRTIKETRTRTTTLREALETIPLLTIITQTADLKILQTIPILMAASETILKAAANRIVPSKAALLTEAAEGLDKKIINKKTNS